MDRPIAVDEAKALQFSLAECWAARLNMEGAIADLQRQVADLTAKLEALTPKDAEPPKEP